MKNNYTEDSIKVLKFPENIRQKPTMYIGAIGKMGCTHLAKEVIDNAVDEAINGYGNLIEISISNKNNVCIVRDHGRGIPHNAIEKAFTNLHASGKFDAGNYATSAGTNGVN